MVVKTGNQQRNGLVCQPKQGIVGHGAQNDSFCKENGMLKHLAQCFAEEIMENQQNCNEIHKVEYKIQFCLIQRVLQLLIDPV